MALTTVPGLFGASMMTPEQVQQQELQGLMISPAQMAQLSLPQQITATIANAGSGIGYGAGRMLGGQTADMARANSLNQIMQDISSAGFTSDAEMYTELSRRLAQAGMSQDAMQARAKALEAKRAEQTMTIEQGRFNIAQKAEARAAAREPRELKNLDDQIKLGELRIKELETKLTPLETQLQAATESGADTTSIERQIEAANLEIKKTKSAIEVAEKNAQSARIQALAAQNRVSVEKITGALSFPVRSGIGINEKIQNIPVGRPTSGGKIYGIGTKKLYTLDEFDAQKEAEALGLITTTKSDSSSSSSSAADKNTKPTRDINEAIRESLARQQAIRDENSRLMGLNPGSP